MVFVSPTVDIAFKKLFANKEHTQVVISFLNAILQRTGDKTITKATFLDPYNMPPNKDGKLSIVDIRCTDQADNTYIVEMQVVKEPAYAKRSQYYTAFALSHQMAKGGSYDNLTPVIFIGVLDFILFKNSNYISHHFILDSETHEHVLDQMEFHFLELPKFTKSLDELVTDSDKWIHFLKEAQNYNLIPSELEEPKALQDAFQILAQYNWTAVELELYIRSMDSMHGEKRRLEATAKESKAEGRLEEKQETAKKLLRRMNIEEISEITGLSVEDILKLQQESNKSPHEAP